VPAQAQRLVSVVKMATLPWMFTTEEQRNVVLFLVGKRTQIKKKYKNILCLQWEMFVA
jgi:hypothetical protein